MPIIKSAKKRVRQSRKATARNTRTKRSLKAALKAFGVKADTKTHGISQSAIDTAVKKGLIHKNKAARLKKRLAAQAKAAGVKPAKKAAAKATPTKKPAAKKAPTRSK